jgi:ribonuclease E
LSEAEGEPAEPGEEHPEVEPAESVESGVAATPIAAETEDQDGDAPRRRRRRGRRGGRRRRRGSDRLPDAADDDRDVAAAPAGAGESVSAADGDGAGQRQPVAEVSAPMGLPPEPAADLHARQEPAWNLPRRSADQPLPERDGDDHDVRSEPATKSRAGEMSDRPAMVVDEGAPAPAGEANGSEPVRAASDAEPEIEPAHRQPAGPPRRGWWKRLIE